MQKPIQRPVEVLATGGFQGSRESLVPATNAKLSEYAAAVGLAGQEGHIFRRVVGWSCLLVYCLSRSERCRSASSLPRTRLP